MKLHPARLSSRLEAKKQTVLSAVLKGNHDFKEIMMFTGLDSNILQKILISMVYEETLFAVIYDYSAKRVKYDVMR